MATPRNPLDDYPVRVVNRRDYPTKKWLTLILAAPTYHPFSEWFSWIHSEWINPWECMSKDHLLRLVQSPTKTSLICYYKLYETDNDFRSEDSSTATVDSRELLAEVRETRPDMRLVLVTDTSDPNRFVPCDAADRIIDTSHVDGHDEQLALIDLFRIEGAMARPEEFRNMRYGKGWSGGDPSKAPKDRWWSLTDPAALNHGSLLKDG